MDYQSMQASQVHPTNIFRERHEFVGQTIGINYCSDQKWYYLDKQSPEEVTIIKIWDNRKDVARCEFTLSLQSMDRKLNFLVCAHCAFQHPEGFGAKVPRESIEVRCLVFYDNGFS